MHVTSMVQKGELSPRISRFRVWLYPLIALRYRTAEAEKFHISLSTLERLLMCLISILVSLNKMKLSNVF